jgi:hypothetical protein
MIVTDTFDMTYTIIPLEQREDLAALRAENATLRELLIDVTGQRNALQQDLHKAQERVS